VVVNGHVRETVRYQRFKVRGLPDPGPEAYLIAHLTSPDSP